MLCLLPRLMTWIWMSPVQIAVLAREPNALAGDRRSSARWVGTPVPESDLAATRQTDISSGLAESGGWLQSPVRTFNGMHVRVVWQFGTAKGLG